MSPYREPTLRERLEEDLVRRIMSSGWCGQQHPKGDRGCTTAEHMAADLLTVIDPYVKEDPRDDSTV